MIETNNKKLFKLVIDKRFEIGEYNFETIYGSVKLVKTYTGNSSEFHMDNIDIYLNGELIFNLKNHDSWANPFYCETLYAHDGEDKIELHNDLLQKENNLTITTTSSPNSTFLIKELNYHKFLAFNKDNSKRFKAQLIENDLCGENIQYNIEDGAVDFFVQIDDSSAVAVPINPNSTAAEEITRLKNKLAKVKKKDTLGLLIEMIFKKYELEKDFDVENLELEEKALKEIADFYNKYYATKEDIFEKLDSNPVFKEVEKYVEKILKEQELVEVQKKADKIKSRIRELEN